MTPFDFKNCDCHKAQVAAVSSQLKEVEIELVRISLQNPVALLTLWEMFREKIKIHSFSDAVKIIEMEIKQ